MAPSNHHAVPVRIREDVEHAIAMAVQSQASEWLVGEDALGVVPPDLADRVVRGPNPATCQASGDSKDSTRAATLNDVAIPPGGDFRAQRLSNAHQLQPLA